MKFKEWLQLQELQGNMPGSRQVRQMRWQQPPMSMPKGVGDYLTQTGHPTLGRWATQATTGIGSAMRNRFLATMKDSGAEPFVGFTGMDVNKYEMGENDLEIEIQMDPSDQKGLLSPTQYVKKRKKEAVQAALSDDRVRKEIENGNLSELGKVLQSWTTQDGKEVYVVRISKTHPERMTAVLKGQQ
jgi:hypothetical protein